MAIMVGRLGIVVGVMAALSVGGCGDEAPQDATPVPAAPVAEPPYIMAPRTRPPGLHLELMSSPLKVLDRLVVYGEPGRADPLTGRVLAVTRQGAMNGEMPKGSRKVDVERGDRASLGRQGAFGWIGWQGEVADEGQDPAHYGVIGHRLTDDELRRAADAVDREHVRVAASGMPEGLRPVAQVPMMMSTGDVVFGIGGAQQWSSGQRSVLRLTTMRADARTELAARLITFGRPARIRGNAGMAGSWVHPWGDTRTLTRVWRERDVIVFADAQGVSEQVLDSAIAELRPIRGREVARLRASITRYPPERLLDPGGHLVSSGRTAEEMWALSAKSQGRPGEYWMTQRGLHVTRGQQGGSSMGFDAPRRGLAVIGVSGHVVGAVGDDVARVRLRRRDGGTTALALGRRPGLGATRWFASSTRRSDRDLRDVVAYDSRGHVVDSKPLD